MIVIIVIVIIINYFLPSVAYDPEGFQKLDWLQKNYKISWNDLPPHQQSSHEVKLRYYYYHYGYDPDDWWGAGVVIYVERGANAIHMVQLMPLPPHHLLLQ